LITALHNQQIFSIADAENPENNNVLSQGWKSAAQLDLQGNLANEWKQYTHRLIDNDIRLHDVEDENI
jgi:hypothetical protein